MRAKRTVSSESTDARSWRSPSVFSVEDVWRDFRFALRSLAKMPGFTAIAVLVIAVGIGSNTAVFSVINTVLLKPLTYPEPQSLAQLMETGPQGSFQGASVPKFNIWRQQTSVFQYVAGYDQGGAGLNLTGGEPEQVQGIHVTADYFRLFGAPTLMGRTFTTAEDNPHGGHVVVLSYGLWKRRFGGDPGMVGRNIQLDGEPFTVVGIIGRGFVTEQGGDVWLPYQFDLTTQDMANYFVVQPGSDPASRCLRPAHS
jgi:putative ABC transport system permease protein